MFTLAKLLFSGEQVPTRKIIEELECSEATLTRYLRELRETYEVTVKYSKSTYSYHMCDAGKLTKHDVAQMTNALKKQEDAEVGDGKVSLTKIKKRAVTVSLSKSIIAKLDRLASSGGSNRSEIIEQLIQNS